MSLEECVAEFAKVIRVIRLMTATATQLVVTLTGLNSMSPSVGDFYSRLSNKKDRSYLAKCGVANFLCVYTRCQHRTDIFSVGSTSNNSWWHSLVVRTSVVAGRLSLS